ncbi:ATP-binding protein [Dasania sp. GY-MA-18]|uniref:histidine kinase n=1 Tax=Dasania phycosphaerae TaxID=2950436 RepID=A0A9J6RN12_9GAMM|nr:MULTISPECIES: ATP-binding protein [Dasania]MCR8923443.1 ATP-binding protein [Dasania sp. GY-MA-18]MCZ0865876.1 ATP-binding protein [Dasania phycosphaerae]MCZ0869600.1 ATP-binding protein [Dasania phycosphaerae]
MAKNQSIKKTLLRSAYSSLVLLLVVLSLSSAYASPISYFKEDGRTNWQYIANFSSGVLIILLSCTAISLFFSSRKTKKANRALREIREALEQRVQERTATLAESNQRLLDEVEKHKKTSERLLASETYIKNILASMPSMLVGLNSHMQITQWNVCAEEITGISADKVLGKDLWDAYPAVTLSRQQIEEVINEQKPATIKHNQRGQYYFDITIYPLKDHSEAGVVILIDNVTQRSIAENKLIQRDKMSSMGELAASMAHDIDTPLQAIFKDLQSIQKAINPSDPALAADLNDAIDKANQASQIIRNLLEFAHSNDRKKRPENLTELIDHTLELAGNAFSDPSGLHFKDIVIEREYQADLPAIPCYKTELQQVFLSLFRHACHALASSDRNDTPTIKIKLLTCYDSLWLKIQHNGLGLTGKEQHEIFEPFFHDRINPKSTEAENRLSFSQFIIVEHHQGHIFVTSDVDVGTTFHIEFQLPQK